MVGLFLPERSYLVSILVEVVCYTIEDVYRAREGGAHCVELCADPGAGGTTPNYGLIKQSVLLGDIDVMVMIRPRGGDFLYTSEELAEMEDDIRVTAELGARGVVFGILDDTGFIDTFAMSCLVQLAKSLGLEVTCHRAFDVARDPHEFLDVLLELGVDRLLTSGQQKTAVEGIPLLQELIKRSEGRISIMPGGGVRPHNVQELLKLNIKEVHTGSSVKVPSKMKPSSSQVKMGDADVQEYHTFVDVDAIRAIVDAVK